MKKQGVPLLFAVTLLFVGFVIGFCIGQTRSREPVLVSVPTSAELAPTQAAVTEPETASTEAVISFPIDINTADEDALLALPGIGPVLVQRILDYRAKVGAFSAPEELMLVEGIGEKRLEQILDLITIGG